MIMAMRPERNMTSMKELRIANQCTCFRVSGMELGVRFGVWGWGLEVGSWGLGFGWKGSNFRVQGSGLRV